MPLLIDGHNLINALPDISLDDPNDEALLVEKLRSYCGRTRQRCTVVFDGGIPGGLSRDLSTGQVQVVFAPAGRSDADRIIIQRIRRMRDPRRITLISSDHVVQNAGLARRMTVMRSEDFADQMQRTMHKGRRRPTDEPPPDVHVSPNEVAMWMRLFGVDDDEE